MRNLQIFLAFTILLALSSCIGEDIVYDTIPEKITINNLFSNFKVGETTTLDAFFLDNVGSRQAVVFDIQSDNNAVVEVDNITKKFTAKSKGSANIAVSTIYKNKKVENKFSITVIDAGTITEPIVPTKIGTFRKTSSYESAGDFEIIAISGGIRIKFASNYVADKTLPGFAMYLTNNSATREGALKIDYQGDANGVVYKGAFSLDIMGIGLNDFGYLTHWCDPFNIRVGEAEIKNK